MRLSADEKRRFDSTVREAMEAAFKGWDFSYVSRWEAEEPKPWNYEVTVARDLAGKEVLLDMGTGGGEVLASLQPLPARTCATEAYPPNVPVARARL